MHPQLEGLTSKRQNTRVVFADVGLAGRKINWDAPIITQHGIHGIPYMFIVDSGGHVSASGDRADQMVQGWLAQ